VLVDTIKKRIMAAMKAKNDLEKEVLRVALGDIQTEEARGTEITDAYCEKVLKKLVKSNRETLTSATDPEQKSTLEQEIVILESLLPKTLSPEQISAELEPVKDQIRAAGNDGQATGVAMKHLKASGAMVDGKDVAAAVRQLRA
jgi:hypothetical protein